MITKGSGGCNETRRQGKDRRISKGKETNKEIRRQNVERGQVDSIINFKTCCNCSIAMSCIAMSRIAIRASTWATRASAWASRALAWARRSTLNGEANLSQASQCLLPPACRMTKLCRMAGVSPAPAPAPFLQIVESRSQRDLKRQPGRLGSHPNSDSDRSSSPGPSAFRDCPNRYPPGCRGLQSCRWSASRGSW